MRLIYPVLAMALMLAGCAGTKVKPPASAAAAPPALDASYDWRVLVTARFGTLLKELPFTVHEVLLFQDASRKPTSSEDAECYASDAKLPTFIERMPDQYLLCFKHDRLARIDAAVHLPPASAATIFSDACGLWMKPVAAPAGATLCTGTNGTIQFSGRLESGSDEHASDDALLSVTLTSVEPD